MSEEKDRLGILGLFALLAFGVLGICALTYMGFLAYLAWKNNRTEPNTGTPVITREELRRAEAVIEELRRLEK